MTMIRFGPNTTDDVWGQCETAGVHSNSGNPRKIECQPGFAPNGKHALLLIDSKGSGATASPSAMVLFSPSLALSTITLLMKVVVAKQTAVGFRLADASFRNRVFLVGDDFNDDDMIQLDAQGIEPIQVKPATPEALANAMKDVP